MFSVCVLVVLMLFVVCLETMFSGDVYLPVLLVFAFGLVLFLLLFLLPFLAICHSLLLLSSSDESSEESEGGKGMSCACVFVC
uniref:Uncharacterized protein n=1 Tax=Octopus bimaculoides TaxID=37653 RepID=A0A0L8GEM8_OCTBM